MSEEFSKLAESADLLRELIPRIQSLVQIQEQTNLQILNLTISNNRIVELLERLIDEPKSVSRKKSNITSEQKDHLSLKRTKKGKPTFKYKLKEIIENELPKSMKMSTIEKILLEQHGITQNEFYRDRNAPFNSNYSIPGDRLLVYSQMFDVSIEGLMNHTVKITPIVNREIKTPLR